MSLFCLLIYIYIHIYKSITRDLRAALKSMRISPEPAYIEVDARPDVEILLPVLARLFGVENSEDSFPILLIGGQQVKV